MNKGETPNHRFDQAEAASDKIPRPRTRSILHKSLSEIGLGSDPEEPVPTSDTQDEQKRYPDVDVG